MLIFFVKEFKQRITKAGGCVPAGHLEKVDLVAALQPALPKGGSGTEAKAAAPIPVTPAAAAPAAVASTGAALATTSGPVDTSWGIRFQLKILRSFQ